MPNHSLHIKSQQGGGGGGGGSSACIHTSKDTRVLQVHHTSVTLK